VEEWTKYARQMEGQLSALQVSDFVCIAPFQNKSALKAKSEAKFRTFCQICHISCKMREGLAKCLRQLYEFTLGPNLKPPKPGRLSAIWKRVYNKGQQHFRRPSTYVGWCIRSLTHTGSKIVIFAVLCQPYAVL